MSDGRFAHVRGFESEELHRGVKALEELQASDGWRLLSSMLVAQEAVKVKELSFAPSRGERADSFGLRQARAGGVVDGLRFALEAPTEVLRTARSELEGRQIAAEQAAVQGDE